VKECSNKTGKDTNNSFLPGYQFGEEISFEKRKEAFNRFVCNNIMLIELRTERIKNQFKDESVDRNTIDLREKQLP